MGTWNLENLFRPEAGNDAGRPEAESAAPSSLDAYEAKLATLTAVIDGLDVDVLAVQEVGSFAALAELAERLNGSWSAATASPDGRGIRVGVLSRLPVVSSEQVTAFPAGLPSVVVDDEGRTLESLGRPALRVRVGAPSGAAVDVVSVHLKSKLLSFPGGRFSPRDEDERARFQVYALHRRAAEASGVRADATRVLAADGRETHLVVAGDLNDEQQAATTQILAGPPGSEIGTGGFDRPDAGDATRLWNLAPAIPADERWSRMYRGRRELIDHIFVSRATVEALVDVHTAGPVPPSIGDDPDERRDDPGSDHRPVVASVDL